MNEAVIAETKRDRQTQSKDSPFACAYGSISLGPPMLPWAARGLEGYLALLLGSGALVALDPAMRCLRQEGLRAGEDMARMLRVVFERGWEWFRGGEVVGQLATGEQGGWPKQSASTDCRVL